MNKRTKPTIFLTMAVALGILLIFGASTVVFGGDYPSKPIRMIYPFPAGSGGDIATRIFADAVAKELGKPAKVTNVTGGRGTIGAAKVVQAKKDGYEQISVIFSETADNEKEHAELFFKHLEGGDAEIIAKYPAGVIGNTSQNLQAAASGEKLEWGTLYPNFAEVAKKEGFNEIANTFRRVALVEAQHERRYLKLLNNIESDQVFKRPGVVKWKCRNCGHVLEASEAPKRCPVCDHEQKYFELWCENY